MKKIDLGQAIGILANLGVIAGIVFLGIELRQNNALMEFETSRSQLEIELTRIDNLLENSALRNAMYRTITGANPSEEALDEVIVRFSIQKLILTFEWQFLEQLDRRDRLRLQVAGTFSIPREIWWETWVNMREVLDPEFVSFFEDATGTD